MYWCCFDVNLCYVSSNLWVKTNANLSSDETINYRNGLNLNAPSKSSYASFGLAGEHGSSSTRPRVGRIPVYPSFSLLSVERAALWGNWKWFIMGVIIKLLKIVLAKWSQTAENGPVWMPEVHIPLALNKFPGKKPIWPLWVIRRRVVWVAQSAANERSRNTSPYLPPSKCACARLTETCVLRAKNLFKEKILYFNNRIHKQRNI